MRKKIFIYTENYVPGGGNRFLIDIINSLHGNHEIVLFSNPNGLFQTDIKSITSNIPPNTIPIKSLPILKSIISNRIISLLGTTPLLVSFFFEAFFKVFGLFFLMLFIKKNIKSFSLVIEKIKPDIIIACNGGYPGGVSCLDLILAANKQNIPSILTVVSVPQRRKVFEKVLYYEISKATKLIIVNSALIKTKLIERGYHPNKISIINNAVDQRSIENPRTFLDFVKRDSKNSETWIGYIGRIETSKGVFELLRAFEAVSHTFSNAKLILVGAGEDYPQILKLVGELGIKKKVILTGYFDGNIYDALATFDLFVFPSHWEGLPYSLLEAMNAGKIIISSNVGGIPEAIENGKEGILIAPKNTHLLREKIYEILNDPASFNYLTINAQKRIKETFTKTKFNEKINSLIASIT